MQGKSCNTIYFFFHNKYTLQTYFVKPESSKISKMQLLNSLIVLSIYCLSVSVISILKGNHRFLCIFNTEIKTSGHVPASKHTEHYKLSIMSIFIRSLSEKSHLYLRHLGGDEIKDASQRTFSKRGRRLQNLVRRTLPNAGNDLNGYY